MAKKDSTRCRKRQTKILPSEAVEEEDIHTEELIKTASTNKEIIGKEETAPTDSKEMEGEEETQNEKDTQMDVVIEVKGQKSTITVSWDKETGEGEGDDLDNTKAGGQTMERVNGKRKAQSTVESSPSKKPKLINEGFCIYVGNLNNSKTFEEIKEALAKYLMTQSLLFQDIRLDRSKKHAYVDLASEIDLTKALTLNGEAVLDMPMKIEKAKIKMAPKVKVKPSAEEKRVVKDARCLFLKNVPYNATKENILEIFSNAIDVRFPGGDDGPSKGIAFVEFKDKTIAMREKKEKQHAKIQGRVLVVDFVGESNGSRSIKTKDNKKTKAAPSPSNTLFVSNLSYTVKEKHLKNVFKKAVCINMPQNKSKPNRYAFVEFANVEDAEKALQSTQNHKICKREIKVEFGEKQDKANVLSNTLIVMGLSEKTSADNLQSAFEGALNARVIVDKLTGLSKRFGFVEFESDENCKAVKEAMEDCEIDGSKVTVAYAKSKIEKSPQDPVVV